MQFIGFLKVVSLGASTMPVDAVCFVLASLAILYVVWLLRGEL